MPSFIRKFALRHLCRYVRFQCITVTLSLTVSSSDKDKLKLNCMKKHFFQCLLCVCVDTAFQQSLISSLISRNNSLVCLFLNYQFISSVFTYSRVPQGCPHLLTSTNESLALTLPPDPTLEGQRDDPVTSQHSPTHITDVRRQFQTLNLSFLTANNTSIMYCTRFSTAASVSIPRIRSNTTTTPTFNNHTLV